MEHPKFGDDVSQLSGKINEKFEEWVTDVGLWEAEHKETKPRLGTPLQERTSSTAEADHQDIAWSGRPCELHCERHRDAQK